jgi:uncharacterized membrane protein
MLMPLIVEFIIVTVVIAAIPTLAALFGRRKNCPDFIEWRKSEGWQIFIACCLAD